MSLADVRVSSLYEPLNNEFVHPLPKKESEIGKIELPQFNIWRREVRDVDGAPVLYRNHANGAVTR